MTYPMLLHVIRQEHKKCHIRCHSLAFLTALSEYEVMDEAA